jgi:isopentenyldiphosphate isomerase
VGILETNENELWDIYDRDRVLTGKVHQRGNPLENNKYHLVVHVCIFNNKNELLIQQRQPWKDGWPDMWDVSAAGSALAGEDSIKAAERETREELGYELDLTGERPYFTINFQYGFDDFYLVKRDIELDQLTLQHEEVQAVRWADKEKVSQMVQEGKFISYYFLDALFEMREHRGAIRDDG